MHTNIIIFFNVKPNEVVVLTIWEWENEDGEIGEVYISSKF